jgi:hypothetical protein
MRKGLHRIIRGGARGGGGTPDKGREKGGWVTT